VSTPRTGHRKSWQERLASYPGLPEVKAIPQRMQARHGPGTILTPSPREVDEAMRRVPEGRLATVFGIGQQLARPTRHAAQAVHRSRLSGGP
jgi:hypothetical protein